MDFVWNWIVATGFMLVAILAVCGFVILAPVYVVRKELISKLISRTYYYLASDSKNLDLDGDDLRETRPPAVPRCDRPMWKFLEWAGGWVVCAKDLCAVTVAKHRKNRGRFRRNRLATAFFLTMTASVGVSSLDISPGHVLNPYAEPGITSEWLKESLGLPDWRVIVPIVIIPHRVIPAVGRKLIVRWTSAKENYGRNSAGNIPHGMVTCLSGFIKANRFPRQMSQRPFSAAMRTSHHLFRIQTVNTYWRIPSMVTLRIYGTRTEN
jgi:hypothetical protein